MRENRETPRASGSNTPDRREKATSYTTSMHASGESDEQVVPAKRLRDKKQKFTALLHHVTTDLLRDSYFSLKRKAAPGVDGITWEQYGEGLEERLKDLHDRIHRGAYPPNRRGEHTYPKPMAGNGH